MMTSLQPADAGLGPRRDNNRIVFTKRQLHALVTEISRDSRQEFPLVGLGLQRTGAG